MSLEKIPHWKTFTSLLLTKYYANDQMKESGMSVACGTYVGEEKCTPIITL
jgi:hypothetical protein